jgi:hypothetical protein
VATRIRIVSRPGSSQELLFLVTDLNIAEMHQKAYRVLEASCTESVHIVFGIDEKISWSESGLLVIGIFCCWSL